MGVDLRNYNFAPGLSSGWSMIHIQNMCGVAGDPMQLPPTLSGTEPYTLNPRPKTLSPKPSASSPKP